MKLSLSSIGTSTPCQCGRVHSASLTRIEIGAGVIEKLPEIAAAYGKKPYILDDPDTHSAAGERVSALLADFAPVCHTLPHRHPEPDEATVGSAMLHFDHACDMVIAVGSGVVGDTAKIVARTAKIPLITVATAPSMDGYASATSSMTRDGLKVTIDSCCPRAIVADTDIVRLAPAKMLAAGVGDMAAKYTALCEWRISHLVTGEFYCEAVADAVREAVGEVVKSAAGLAKREPAAVEAVMRGLILSGVAMTWAGLSRPASGTEHSISHIWDMRAGAIGTPMDLHGIQCGIGTRMVIKICRRLREFTPDKAAALAHAKAFDRAAHLDFLREFMGSASAAMVAGELRDDKYAPEKHAARLDIILEKWPEIVRAMDEELPTLEALTAAMQAVGAPMTPEEIGLSDRLCDTIRATRDIRDKYILSRLIWDLGLSEEDVLA